MLTCNLKPNTTKNFKQLMSDPLYAKFAKNVADIRTMVNSVMLIRLADF